jgi:hypothetical protein
MRVNNGTSQKEYTLKEVKKINELPDWAKPVHFREWYSDDSFNGNFINSELIDNEGKLKDPPNLRQKKLIKKERIPEDFVSLKEILDKYKETTGSKRNFSGKEFIRYCFSSNGSNLENFYCMVGKNAYVYSKLFNEDGTPSEFYVEQNLIKFKELKERFEINVSSSRFVRELNLPEDFFTEVDKTLYVNKIYNSQIDDLIKIPEGYFSLKDFFEQNLRDKINKNKRLKRNGSCDYISKPKARNNSQNHFHKNIETKVSEINSENYRPILNVDEVKFEYHNGHTDFSDLGYKLQQFKQFKIAQKEGKLNEFFNYHMLCLEEKLDEQPNFKIEREIRSVRNLKWVLKAPTRTENYEKTLKRQIKSLEQEVYS